MTRCNSKNGVPINRDGILSTETELLFNKDDVAFSGNSSLVRFAVAETLLFKPGVMVPPAQYVGGTKYTIKHEVRA